MNRQIYIQTQFVGYHRWDDAPEEVAFLRNIHRHIFHVKVSVPVKHNNRDIEFFMLKQLIDDFIENHIVHPALAGDGNMGSCEMIGEQIAIYTHKHYQFKYNDIVSVEVSEDSENGAIIRT